MSESIVCASTIKAVVAPAERGVSTTFSRSSIGRICTLVRTACMEAAIAPRDVEDLLIAVSEIALNALSYAGGYGAITVKQAGSGVIVEIHDDGPGLPDDYPLSQFAPADAGELHGLRIARLMCREFAVTSSAQGVSVRMSTSGRVYAESVMTR